MKIETILNAMRDAGFRVVLNDEPNKESYIRHRQFHACRDRIIRIDERNKMKIAELEGHNYALNLYIEETEMGSEKSLVKGREQ